MVEPVWFRRCLGGACLVAALAGGGAAAAQPEPGAAASGPFAAFAGEWVGGGTIAGSNGTRERIRCRASETESFSGVGLSQSIVCASASYRLDIQSEVEAHGRNVSGAWSEQTRGASGELTGTVAPGRFDGAVTGQNFTAEVSLRSNGRRQTVRIVPRGADISDVNIELQRRD